MKPERKLESFPFKILRHLTTTVMHISTLWNNDNSYNCPAKSMEESWLMAILTTTEASGLMAEVSPKPQSTAMMSNYKSRRRIYETFWQAVLYVSCCKRRVSLTQRKERNYGLPALITRSYFCSECAVYTCSPFTYIHHEHKCLYRYWPFNYFLTGLYQGRIISQHTYLIELE